MSETTYYKFLNEGGYGPFSRVRWHLPDDDGTPGEWMPSVEGAIVECRNGYHVCREEDLARWVRAELYVVELRGDVSEYDHKVAGREARLLHRVEAWNKSSMRMFAIDCAERVLPIFEKRYPDNKRPADAIDAARRFVRGEVST